MTPTLMAFGMVMSPDVIPPKALLKIPKSKHQNSNKSQTSNSNESPEQESSQFAFLSWFVILKLFGFWCLRFGIYGQSSAADSAMNTAGTPSFSRPAVADIDGKRF